MKKILTTVTLVLVLIFCFSTTVFANDLGGGESYGGASGSGTGGGAGTGSQDRKDGFLATKSGYIVYTSNASGSATSEIVAFCWDGGSPYSTTGAPVFPLI